MTNNIKPITGLVIGGPLDGTYLAHNEETYKHVMPGARPDGMAETYEYEWDCIHCGPQVSETVSFWRPKKRSTFWMVAKLSRFYQEQAEMIRNRDRERGPKDGDQDVV